MGSFWLLFVIFALIVGIVWYFGWQAAKKRREAMTELANRLGLSFQDEKDYSLDERFSFLNKLCQGDNRYGFNILSGEYRGQRVIVFDYHYETTSTDSDGNRQTHHHYFSFFILFFDGMFPELLIHREGWFSRVTQFFGFDDIDFESAEFSRLFLVKSRDKKFAYDICHGQMIDYLLDNRDLSIEIERGCLTLFFERRLKPEEIQPNLDRLVTIREMFPAYLLAQT